MNRSVKKIRFFRAGGHFPNQGMIPISPRRMKTNHHVLLQNLMGLLGSLRLHLKLLHHESDKEIFARFIISVLVFFPLTSPHWDRSVQMSSKQHITSHSLFPL